MARGWAQRWVVSCPVPCSRLHSNHLFCDCHLAWLSQWLRQRPTIGLFTQCSGPAGLRGLNVAEVQKSEFSCSGGCRPGWGSPLTVHHLPPAAPCILFPPVTSCQHTLTSGPPITSCSHLSSPISTQHLLPYPSPSRPPTISCAYPLSPVPIYHLSLPIPPNAHPLSPVLIHCLCLHMSPLASTPLFLLPPPILSSHPPHCFLSHLLFFASIQCLLPFTPTPHHPLPYSPFVCSYYDLFPPAIALPLLP